MWVQEYLANIVYFVFLSLYQTCISTICVLNSLLGNTWNGRNSIMYQNVHLNDLFYCSLQFHILFLYGIVQCFESLIWTKNTYLNSYSNLVHIAILYTFLFVKLDIKYIARMGKTTSPYKHSIYRSALKSIANGKVVFNSII